MGNIQNPQAVPHLIKTLQDSDEDVRQASAEALAQIGKPAVPPLIQALKDRNWRVRQASAEALGRIGEASALPAPQEALNKATSDEERKAIQNAIDAIQRASENAK